MENPYWVEPAMRAALAIAEKNQTPFGAVLVDAKGKVLYQAANTGRADGPTAHAELNLLREASSIHGKLTQYYLITTCEPCPMCMGAAIWCQVAGIYYGVSIPQAATFLKQIFIPSQTIAEASFYQPVIYGGMLEEEGLGLFERLFPQV